LALGVEPAEPGVMRRRARRPRESVFSGGLGVGIAWQGILLGLLTLGAYWWGLNHGTPAQARTLAFATLVFTQLAHSFNVRSTDASLFTIGWFTNRPLLLAVAVSAVLQLAVMTVPFLEPVFDVTPLDAQHWRVLLPAAAAPWVGVELVKALRRRSSAARRGALDRRARLGPSSPRSNKKGSPACKKRARRRYPAPCSKTFPARTYSPARWPGQYHRRWRA